MILFVLAAIALLVGIGLLAVRHLRLIGAGVTVLAIVLALFSSVYSQTVGQASVIVSAGGTIVSANTEPGWALKAPWNSRSEWDLFSQSATYAGGAGSAPSYTGGEVQGQSVTSTVKGGAQADLDLSVTYSLEPDSVLELYTRYRSQERFVQQVVEPRILSVVRSVPAPYSPVEFRGERRTEVQQIMLDRLNADLDAYGVTVSQVNLQNITFTPEVEESIKQVEIAQQEQAKAEANLRATEVSAQAQVVEAEAEAEANKIRSESLTPQLLQYRWIEAIRESGTTIVVPDNVAPLINIGE